MFVLVCTGCLYGDFKICVCSGFAHHSISPVLFLQKNIFPFNTSLIAVCVQSIQCASLSSWIF